MSLENSENESLLRSVNNVGSYDATDQTYVGIALLNKKRKNTIRVINFTMFLGSISFSIVMSSLWPYLRKLDHSVTETFMGYINAAFSTSQMIAGIIFGYWSDKRKAIEPLYLSVLLQVVGSCLYAYAEPFGVKGIWVLFGARILLGLSAGSISVARSVGAHISTQEDRGKIMADLSLWQAIGFFIGPAMQAMAKLIGKKGLYVTSIKLYINIYTAPCYLMIILSVVNLVVLFFYFTENLDNSKLKFKENIKRLRRASVSLEPVDLTAVLLCLVFWYAAMSIFALNETILSPLLMNEYAWSRDKTVFYGSILLSVAGAVAVFCFLATSSMIKKFGSRAVALAGFILMLAGFIIYLPWGPGYPKLTMANIIGTNSTSSDGGGCPYFYDWCKNTPSLSFGQFITAATLVGIGYPIAAVVLTVLYSNIVGPFPQGKYMGWLTGVGCLARVTGPLYVTAMYEHFGMRWMATTIDCMLLLTILLFTCFWKRLVSYNEKRQIRTLTEVFA